MTRKRSKKSSYKKSRSHSRLWWVVALLVLIPVCYGLLLYYQQNHPQQKSSPPITAQHGKTKPKTPSPAPKTPVHSSIPVSADLQIPTWTTTRPEQVIRHTGYTVSYNKTWKLPNWVSYELVRNETQGKEKRNNRFVADPLVKGPIATNGDYAGSGYDKGHMAPAADMKWSNTAMKESFYFSNMCPQHPQLNRRGWKKLEDKIRDWAVADSAIIVICGPIVSKNPKTIGKNKVAVPQRFFKVVLAPFAKPMRAIGFLFNNGQAVEPLSTYVVTVDSIESLTGIDFFASLPDEIENVVEAHANLREWNR